MEIYRIETSDGGGIYRGNFGGGAWYDGDYTNPRHPLPYEDARLAPGWNGFRGRFSHTMRFGFTSWEQLRSWIYREEWREALRSLGCQVSVYEVDPEYALIGDTQAVFAKAHARLSRVEQLA